MRSFRSDPYLWVHLAGIAAVPLLLELCLLGLAVSHPFLPTGLEFLLVGLIGVVPVLWMQWQRPFSIFSLVVLALQPEQLTADQRRILRSFKAPLERILAALSAIVLLAILWQLYQIAPIASEVTPFVRFGRLGGILVATIAFLGSNLFLQIPVSVLRVLLTPEHQLAAMEPHPIEGIAQDFTLLGIRVKKILPTIVDEAITAQPIVEKVAISKVAPVEPPAEDPLEASATADPAVVSVLGEAVEDDFEDEQASVEQSINPTSESLERIEPPALSIENLAEIDSAEIGSAEIHAEEIRSPIAEGSDAESLENLIEVITDLPEESIAIGLEIPETDPVLIEITSEAGEMIEVVVTEDIVEETITLEITALADELASEPETLAGQDADEAIALKDTASGDTRSEPSLENGSNPDEELT
jgi:hypothetical protein